MQMIGEKDKMVKLTNHNDMVVQLIKEDLTFGVIYLQDSFKDAIEEDDISIFLTALRRFIDAHGGIGKVAKKGGLNRTTLYKTLESKKPSLPMIFATLSALGCKSIKLEFPNLEH